MRKNQRLSQNLSTGENQRGSNSKNWKEKSGHATLIIDGAWKQNKERKYDPGVAAYGWVLFYNSREIAEGSQIIDANSAMQAEAFALLFGIRNHQIKFLEIWTDSKQLVEGLRENKNTPLSVISLGISSI